MLIYMDILLFSFLFHYVCESPVYTRFITPEIFDAITNEDNV